MRIKSYIGFLLGFFTFTIFAVYFAKPYGVSQFGPLKLGMISPIKPGDSTSLPYGKIPESDFYVYAVQKDLPTACVFAECGMSGVIVECMGGWITGDQQAETADQFGLNFDEVVQGESSIIVVADKDSKIVGIYPNKTTHNIPTILKKHPTLSPYLNKCLDYNMPR